MFSAFWLIIECYYFVIFFILFKSPSYIGKGCHNRKVVSFVFFSFWTIIFVENDNKPPIKELTWVWVESWCPCTCLWLEHCAPHLTVFRFFANLRVFAGQIVPQEGEREQEFAGDGCSEFDPCQNTEQSSNAESWFTNRNHVKVMNFKALMSHLVFMEAPGPLKQHMLYNRAIKRSEPKMIIVCSTQLTEMWFRGAYLFTEWHWLPHFAYTWVDFPCCHRDYYLSQLMPNGLSLLLVQDSMALILWTVGYLLE